MIRKLAVIAIAALAFSSIAGCAGFADVMSAASGMGVVSTHHNTFDDSTTVKVTPLPLYSPGAAINDISMGARWNTITPDYVALVLSYGSSINSAGTAYMRFDSLDVNINGDITHLRPGSNTSLSSSGYNTVSHNIYTTSQNAIVVPWTMLERMVAAKDCRLRVHTGQGYEDMKFSAERIPGGQPTAIHGIKKLMAKVDAVRAGH